ncbi:MAG: YraN family protein [Pseudomonadota bacterium]
MNPRRRKSKRQKAERTGRRSEQIASFMLRLKGYTILETRLKTHKGEIDIVARRKDLLVFVEVKARPTVETAILAVTPQARRRIEAAAHLWASRIDPAGQLGRRFDLVAVCPRQWPTHVRDAWRPDFEPRRSQ